MVHVEHPNVAWDVQKLLGAAIGAPGFSKHIPLKPDASQLIAVPTGTEGHVAAPAGTAFDPEEVKIDVLDGRMGDVVEVDLKRRAAFGLQGITAIPPAPISKGTNNLLATDEPVALTNLDAQKLTQDLQTDFDFNPGELDMLYVNMPETAPVQIPTPAAIVSTVVTAKPMRTDGVCYIVSQSPEWSGQSSVNEMGYDAYMQDFLPKDFVQNHLGKGGFADDHKKYSDWSDSLEVTITKQPLHGKMAVVPVWGPKLSYVPNKNYLGKDRVEVEIRGKDFDGRAIAKKVIYFINVVPFEKMDDIIAKYTSALQKYCGTNKPAWKISDSEQGSSYLVTWQQNAALHSLVASASRAIQGYQDLPGSSVGQTTGEGASAKITLDFTAAGHGWYVDPTHLDNTDDQLPTSDPNIWQAKAGSDDRPH